MKILITNDDGITAPGLVTLCNYLHQYHEVFVVAPDNERSGVSQSITYRRPVFHKEYRIGSGIHGIGVNGYPVDCVKVAMFELCPFRPDVVVSGINSGLNVGLNVGHSGTVAGAIAGAQYGLASVALSLEENHVMYFERSIQLVWPVVRTLVENGQNRGTVLNVNIPTAALSGDPNFAVVPMNANNMGYHFEKGLDPKGRPYHWQTNQPDALPLEQLCDTYAVARGLVAITPLSPDLTHHERLEALTDRLQSSRTGSGT
jgi:5'-nucleotidase